MKLIEGGTLASRIEDFGLRGYGAARRASRPGSKCDSSQRAKRLGLRRRSQRSRRFRSRVAGT
jgi:hypothetical protein